MVETLWAEVIDEQSGRYRIDSVPFYIPFITPFINKYIARFGYQ